MSNLLLPFLLVLLPIEDSPQALLERGIQEMGGEENLKKLAKARYLSEATTYAAGQPQQEMKLDRILRLPDCMNLKLTLGTGDKKQVSTFALNRDGGWTQVGSDVEEMRPRTVAAFRDDLYVLRLQYLWEAKEPRYQLKLLPSKLVEGLPAKGLLVKAEGVPEVSLFFDEKSGRLVKSETFVRDPVVGNLLFQEVFLKDYQELPGLKVWYPMSSVIYHNYGKYMEMKMKSIEPRETIRDSEFLRPG